MIFRSSGFNENRFRTLLVLQAVWLFLILILGSWWAYFITNQSEQIYQLSLQAGMTEAFAFEHKIKTERMIYWEILTFFVFIIGSSLLMFWLYWKDLKRTQGLAHFFSALTHEIKTPLTSIKLQAETLEDQFIENDHAKKLLKRLLEDSGKLENQVIRSLELARLEGGGQLFLQGLPLKKTIEKIIKDFQESQINNKAHHIHLQCDPNIFILSDQYSFETILRNLLENSLQHNKNKTLEIHIQANQNHPWIHIQYRDNGQLHTMNEKNLGTLFLRGSHSKGAGIGLYLCKIMTERMNGKMIFKKDPDKNYLTVSLYLKSSDPLEES